LSGVTVYTLWVALAEDPTGFWMMEARDEFSWEGDPEGCEQAFEKAKAKAKREDWIWREINLVIPFSAIEKPFEPSEVVPVVEERPA
jgi:hypothetical protein